MNLERGKTLVVGKNRYKVENYRNHAGQAEVVTKDQNGKTVHLVLADVLRGIEKGAMTVV